MTTLVALNTRDALVMGCDSLGTVTKRLINPWDLADYFDDDLKTKVGPDGKPLLDDFSKIYDKSRLVPYDHMTHVDKLFPLTPLKMGVMFAGEVAIGDRTIKNLVGEFKSTDDIFKRSTPRYTLRGVGRKLLKFLWGYYFEEYPEERGRPELEVMLGGYDSQKRTPGIIRINVHEKKIKTPDYDFGVYFGGQMKEIQRLGHGTDLENRVRLIRRVGDLLNRYRTLLNKQLEDNGIQIKLAAPTEFGEELHLFKNWDVEGMDANWGAFSEQNAIDCVDFLVNIMVKSQQFSSQMPSVGGEVQLAVIKKDSGFIFVSKREWRHGDHAIPIKE